MRFRLILLNQTLFESSPRNPLRAFQLERGLRSSTDSFVDEYRHGLLMIRPIHLVWHAEELRAHTQVHVAGEREREERNVGGGGGGYTWGAPVLDDAEDIEVQVPCAVPLEVIPTIHDTSHPHNPNTKHHPRTPNSKPRTPSPKPSVRNAQPETLSPRALEP